MLNFIVENVIVENELCSGLILTQEYSSGLKCRNGEHLACKRRGM